MPSFPSPALLDIIALFNCIAGLKRKTLINIKFTRQKIIMQRNWKPLKGLVTKFPTIIKADNLQLVF
jgi:hypothetical protein